MRRRFVDVFLHGGRLAAASVMLLVGALQAEIDPIAAGECLQAAYPQTVVAQGAQVVVGGQTLPIGKAPTQDYQQQLNTAGLIDQLSQAYPLHFGEPPARNQDPGRLRYEPFFDAMYGANEQEIRSTLTKVLWAPSGKNITFTSVNGADQALAAVGQALAQRPHLQPLVRATNGTFNYRVIAGTNRKSFHSYGAAIDLTLPDPLRAYWRWTGCKAGSPCAYHQPLLNHAGLQEVVEVFESQGFIWGGKWYHYDSIHFEYRPELLNPTCQFLLRR